MEAKELRIGNYLELLGKIVKVEGISNLPARKEMYWIACNAFEDTKIIHFKPIELNKEWFFKFGYNDVNKPSHFVKDEMSIDEHRFWNCNGMFIDDRNGVRIKYVHQLQNLYFVLYGEELIIKNPTK
jgi:hypothetical protein